VGFSAREERQKIRSDVAGRRDNAGWIRWMNSVEHRQREISPDEPLQLMEGRNLLSRYRTPRESTSTSRRKVNECPSLPLSLFTGKDGRRWKDDFQDHGGGDDEEEKVQR